VKHRGFTKSLNTQGCVCVSVPLPEFYFITWLLFLFTSEFNQIVCNVSRFAVRATTLLLVVIKSIFAICVKLNQGFPTCGTCTPRGTFAYLKGYIYCRTSTNYFWDLKTESAFISVDFCYFTHPFCLRNVRGTCPSFGMLKGHLVRERLGTTELNR